MKHLLLALCLMVTTVLPGSTKEDEDGYYTAVFVNKGFQQFWQNEPVDYLVVPDDWNDLPGFIDTVNKKAGGRPVIIDIDCHGTTDGDLCIAYGDKAYYASVGYLLNQLDRVNDLQCACLEACFAGHCYNKTRVGYVGGGYNRDGNMYENHPDRPTYAIYGADRVTNFGNAVFCQMEDWEYVNFHDLRDYTDKSPGELLGDDYDEWEDARVEVIWYYWKSHELEHDNGDLLE